MMKLKKPLVVLGLLILFGAMAHAQNIRPEHQHLLKKKPVENPTAAPVQNQERVPALWC